MEKNDRKKYQYFLVGKPENEKKKYDKEKNTNTFWLESQKMKKKKIW